MDQNEKNKNIRGLVSTSEDNLMWIPDPMSLNFSETGNRQVFCFSNSL